MKKIMTRLLRIWDIHGVTVTRFVVLRINSCGIARILIRTLFHDHENPA